MNLLQLPWLELAIGVALVGSLWVSRFRHPGLAFWWGLVLSGVTLLCSVLAALSFYFPPGVDKTWTLSWRLFKVDDLLALDELSAPLVPMVALLHFLTALATGRTKMRRFSMSWSLAAEAISLATFGCLSPWGIIILLSINTIPGYVELVNRDKPARVYLVHMALFVGLMVLGWAFVNPDGSHEMQTAWAMVPLLAAILLRCGTLPVHCWVTDWFEHASFGNALLFVAPLRGVYAAVRLVLPIAPDWMLQCINVVSLVTAVYAAGMAVVQEEPRRVFAYLFISHTSLVLVGLELHNELSLTGALALWISVALSLGGFGLTLRALEARFGRLSLKSYHGLYDRSPALAVCFLLTGLGSVGFPGTLGFVATDLLVDGAVKANLYVGLAAALAAAINGIAVVKTYFTLFTGTRHASTVALNIGARERFAVLALAGLILGGGLFPQPGLLSRFRAAEAILQLRTRVEEEARARPGGDATAGQASAQERHSGAL
jgi:NADH-quinone oxidoreductase subunit M